MPYCESILHSITHLQIPSVKLHFDDPRTTFYMFKILNWKAI